MWRVVVAMEQRNSTCHAFGPRYSTGTEDGRKMKGREGHFQLRKGGVHKETDLAVALLDFAFSLGSQAARRATPAIQRSQAACDALTARSPPLSYTRWVCPARLASFFSEERSTRLRRFATVFFKIPLKHPIYPSGPPLSTQLHGVHDLTSSDWTEGMKQ